MKDYLFQVWTTEEFGDLPEGTCMFVESESKINYQGQCSLGVVTFSETFSKKICTNENPLEKLLESIE